MKKQDEKFTARLKLSKKFNSKILQEMEYEFERASEKWGVELTEEEKDQLIDHSFNQLIQKVSENSRINWDLSDEIEVRINGLNGNMILPSETQKCKKTRVLKKREGWTVSSSEDEESISLYVFKDHYEELILTWARTAVFYGVGSYSE